MLNPRNLKVLHKARALSVMLHHDLRGISFAASPDLKRQLLDAVASIPRNIHEGTGKKTVPDVVRFLDIAVGSANEVEECLHLVESLELLPAKECTARTEQTVEVRMMLCGLRKYLRSKDGKKREEPSGSEKALEQQEKKKQKTDRDNEEP